MGIVVNNAILLVHQSRSGERQGLPRDEAVRRALHLRVRPILMSTLTSIFGMLPLLLVPGEGSLMYRGMAGVIVGSILGSVLAIYIGDIVDFWQQITGAMVFDPNIYFISQLPAEL